MAPKKLKPLTAHKVALSVDALPVALSTTGGTARRPASLACFLFPAAPVIGITFLGDAEDHRGADLLAGGAAIGEGL